MVLPTCHVDDKDLLCASQNDWWSMLYYHSQDCYIICRIRSASIPQHNLPDSLTRHPPMAPGTGSQLSSTAQPPTPAQSSSGFLAPSDDDTYGTVYAQLYQYHHWSPPAHTILVHLSPYSWPTHQRTYQADYTSKQYQYHRLWPKLQPLIKTCSDHPNYNPTMCGSLILCRWNLVITC